MQSKFMKHVRANLLTILTIAAVILSIVVGIIIRSVHEDNFPQRTVMYVNFLGDIFLRILRALVLPLIVSSLIVAIAPLDISLSKKIGFQAIAFFISTTIIAIIIGVILVVTIKPGGDGIEGVPVVIQPASTIADTLLDLVRNICPPNVVQATLQTHQTVLTPPGGDTDVNINDWIISSKYSDGTNMLGMVSIAIIFGIAMSAIRSKVINLMIVIIEFSKVMLQITQWIIWLTPVGVFFLILAKFLEMADILDVFGKLGLYLAVVCVGIFIQGFIVLPLIYFAFTRKNPLTFIVNMGPAIATAFGTSSSLATLPVSLKCVEENVKVDVRISRFVMPIGATINMNGTALYEAVAAIFIAQLRRVDLSLSSIIAVSITATAAAVGTAGVPQAGLVTLVMVLDSIGLPAEDISLIIAIDWIVNRVRACVNILGDAYGAAIIDHRSQKELNSLPQIDEKGNEDNDTPVDIRL